MKEFVKRSESISDFKQKEIISAVLSHLFVALIGFIASRAVVLDELLPFGIAWIAGCSLMYTPAAAIGAFLGYLFPAVGKGGFRYIACIFAVLAIKLLLSNYKKLINNVVFLSCISLVSCLLTSAVTLKGIDSSILYVTGEAFLSAGATYFISKCFTTFSKPVSGMSTDELVSLFILISIIIISLNRLSYNGISLGHIFCVALVLTAGKYGGIISGAVSGIAAAFSLILSGVSGNIAVIYAFTGMLSGLFFSMGKYVQVGIMVIFSFTGAVSTGDYLLVAQTVIETALGSVVFLVLPHKVGIYLGKLFSSYPKVSIPIGFKKSLTMRLDVASNALRDVSETVDQVSTQLSKINAPDFSTVISGIEKDACTGCKLRLHCWESRHDDTINAILAITKGIKQGSHTPEKNAPDEFIGRCLRISEVSNATYKRYSDYISGIAAENKIDEVRSVVSDQFDGISSMLSDLASDIDNDEQFDNSIAEKASASLKNLNIRVTECSGRTDKFGRITLEFKIKREPDLVINKLQVMKLVSVVCEREFDIPTVGEIGGDIFLTLYEHAVYRIEVGIEQICASESTMCGDAYKFFNDGRGHFVMVLSDGMGTGGRAAVDGAMASGLMSRLIKAGFGYDCSLRILNSSMLFKSTDESLATVDIASIDLFTGCTSLYKAGAAPTVVRRSGRTGKAESTSLPAGIIREIGFDKADIKCKSGDIVVMMSDGAICDGIDWIKSEVENWDDGTAQELAEKLCTGAKRRRNDNHEDDITVMVGIIKKSV